MSLQEEMEREELELTTPLVRLAKDVRKLSGILSPRKARWLVDTYYQMQDGRIRSKSQLDRQYESAEPNQLIDWVFSTWSKFESALKGALGEFAAQYAVGQWMQAQYGIGPVLSAAMLANFDIQKAQTVGHYWRFAGLDPTCKWEKGKKRPYNAKLKAIVVYRMGECFVKFQNRDECFYGKLLKAKKATLTQQNEERKFAEFAKGEIARCEANKILLSKMQATERWKYWQDGRLCPQNIHDRARRWTVKLFLSHLHHVMYCDYYGKNPPAPYIFEHPELGDHRHLVLPPLYGEGFNYSGKPLSMLYGA